MNVFFFFMLYQRSLKISSYFLILFSFYHSVWIISIALSSSSLMCFSASSSLLLNPSSVFFSSIITSIWYFLIFLFVKVIIVFIPSSPKFSGPLYNRYFELLIKWVAYIHFIKVFFWGFVLFFGLEHISLSVHFA